MPYILTFLAIAAFAYMWAAFELAGLYVIDRGFYRGMGAFLLIVGCLCVYLLGSLR